MRLRFRLAFATVVGTTMSIIIWLTLEEGSSLYRFTLDQPAAGHALMLLNLPALLVARMLVDNTSPWAQQIAATLCFIQWFVICSVLGGVATRHRISMKV